MPWRGLFCFRTRPGAYCVASRPRSEKRQLNLARHSQHQTHASVTVFRVSQRILLLNFPILGQLAVSRAIQKLLLLGMVVSATLS